MSLLDRGPEVVLVYPEVAATDSYGTTVRVPSETPVEVRCHVQPVSATEAELAGQVVSTVYQLIAREFPGGAWSKVVWDGREWDTLGEPRKYRTTARTSHVTVLLAARTAAAL